MPVVRRNRSAKSSSSNSQKGVVPVAVGANGTTTEVLRDETDSDVNDTLAVYFPNTQIAFKLLLCAGFTSAVWSHISDCDEVFNYWEPSHYLIFGKGFQTWEYAPQYGLRSYFYLLIISVPMHLYQILLSPFKVMLFYVLRCVFAVYFTICAVYFYKSICREFGVNIGRMAIVFLVFSPGTFISASAFLPSSFSMFMTMLSIGAWFQRRYELAIMSTAFSALISWPFAAAIGYFLFSCLWLSLRIPIAIDTIFRKRKYNTFVYYSVCAAVILLVAQIEIDSIFYGKYVISPLNMIKYNIFSAHGPSLYGTEPWYFYFLNGLLNFNIGFILALVTPILLFCLKIFVDEKIRHPECLPYELSLSAFYIWFIIFCLQPHKEERFLFPVYPLICLCAAVSIDSLQILYYRFFVKSGLHYLRSTTKFAGVLLVIFGALGVARIIALHKGYHAPLDLYVDLYKIDMKMDDRELNLCVGKEWHRYPSSFFLPSNRWNVHFLKSEFDGLLPGKFVTGITLGTTIERDDMNDKNVEEPSHYVDNVEICDFLIDMDTGKYTDLEPDYSHNSNWTVLLSEPFLDAQSTPQWIRSFYIPFLWERYAKYFPYNLLISNSRIRDFQIYEL